ncbi:hypothetical protein PRB94_gp43 [Klebsiella phage VLCpiS13c]|uniref:hypothetical protein n=1 Tax=Klebsiella phage VLCpiS13c TaxID=2874887 RepID=UPI00233EC139|nr:hypothetical protein PRB94_gp43 [Klebsiella phage VLCpiS13c]UVX30171.1 hypothetical protein S13c_00043 [Klebsiella phage VLCpiS13c]
MTDITELAKRVERIISDVKLKHGGNDTYAPIMKWDEFSALVEALEEAQQERDNWRTSFDNERFRADKLKAHIDEMTEEQTASINELSRIIQKEVKAKREAEKHIAELESRAVTVENLQESAYRAGLTAGWNLGLANNNDGFNKCLAAHTTGIKVEAE